MSPALGTGLATQDVFQRDRAAGICIVDDFGTNIRAPIERFAWLEGTSLSCLVEKLFDGWAALPQFDLNKPEPIAEFVLKHVGLKT